MNEQSPKERASMVAKGYEMIDNLRKTNPTWFSSVSLNGVTQTTLINFTLRVVDGEIKAIPFNI